MELHNSKLKIKIITTETFPVGLAGTNRIMTYAKGFLKNNCIVSVICMIPLDDPKLVFNKLTSGTIDGIYYNYSCGTTIKNKRFINRKFDELAGIFNVCLEILKEKSSDKTDAIIYYSPSTSRALLLYLVTRCKGIIFLKEESELPPVYLRKMNFALQKLVFKKLHFTFFDGLLLMTKRLVTYFMEERKLKKPYLLVPMTVDFDRFSQISVKEKPIRYIAYCGTLNNRKDGVDLLIDAFARLAKDFPEIKLYLIGGSESEEEFQSYIKQVARYQLTEKVLFTGLMNADAIPELLCGASLLVLPRPNSLQAEGGFPTKLGEYLATGNPVIVTRVGEIPDYLTDEVNVFMAEPGNLDSLVSKIEKILLNYNDAQKIGLMGKMVALEFFNYEVQTKKIISFILSLKKMQVQ
jgi:glycosyltransferase involved in cell wall biosynthesis